jgi:predicted hotdog family 3-hydroxylacyl-ACP dehydratase
MTLDRSQIGRLVPHAGAMCLLELVNAWDERTIHCRGAAPHAGHPLARDGVVPAIMACEYAAQATAVHGALLDDARESRPGMLAKIMDVDIHAPSFPDGAQVNVRAELLGRVAAGCLYAFAVDAGPGPVASGRLMVSFAPADPA